MIIDFVFEGFNREFENVAECVPGPYQGKNRSPSIRKVIKKVQGPIPEKKQESLDLNGN